jgi:hypothetical protein
VWFAYQVGRPDRKLGDRIEVRTAPSAALGEVEEMKRSIDVLERKSASLEAAVLESQHLALREGPPSEQGAEEVTEARSGLEMHRDLLVELDVTLQTDQGDPRQRNAVAASFRRELDTATLGRARVLDVECATAFCKATIEEDTSVDGELDTNAIIDATPFLNTEAMFDYERDGSLKRTIVYAAREGQSLPFAREAMAAGPDVGKN